MAIHGNTIGEVDEAPVASLPHDAADTDTLAVDPALVEEVRTGLQQQPKRLSSRFFYDAEGSRIFQAIMHAPEYYLTRSEYEILDTYKAELLELFAVGDRSFDLVELGAGDGLKTKILLSHFADEQADFAYAPVDISADALDGLVADVRSQWPNLRLNPRHDDYFNALEQLSEESDSRRVVLFLGSNIGNFAPDEAVDFYRQLHDRLHPGDLVLTGIDLQKHPAIIHAAYNDRQGLTRAFNLNLLRRLNRDLDANFDLAAFDHYETYSPETGEARSYLVSQKAQTVRIGALDIDVPFAWGEIIHTEISRKFTPAQIEQLAQQAGFRVVTSFTDCKGYFTDVVFEKV
ncbi:L-histidine N(alpha)-methyltransferase [Spirosoma rhododendri]|uniref:L-histidine N(Alpha)-methyltransferase n=1 Tax=Spirosoma rhododendri TaxID=2728024 RepID=A0A7L5DJ61_9BACT|nr:L-histidine N(alpha)-methyltransferase [Spirosoma rhododendri]QJD78426.1 L-histidine N(alpha)-methyltransferase [Spirosoma rhododendri]